MNQPGEVPMQVYKALKRFEYAIKRRAFKGAKMPEEHPAIEKEYENARENLLSKIRKISIPKG